MKNIYKIVLILFLGLLVLLPSCVEDSKPSYNVTLSGVGTYTIEEGNLLGVIADPIQEGYTFVGWYDGDNEFDLRTPITKSLYLTAKFEINQYDVNFHVLDEVTTVKVTYKEKVAKPEDPLIYGYNFGGWQTEGKEEFDFNSKIKGNTDVYAVMDPVKFSISIDIDGVTTSYNYDYLSTISELKNEPSKVGHTFDGWYIGEQKINNNYQVLSNETITAKFTPNTYVVTFIDGDTSTTVDVLYNETVKAPNAKGMEGYKFNWWYVGDEKFKFATPITEDITITAKYNILTFKVQTEANSYINNYVFNYGDTIESIPDPVIEGCTFVGWLLGEEPYDPTTPITCDIYLTASLERAKYIVTIDYPGNQYTEEVYYGRYLVMPKSPMKDGYHFDGWYKGDTKYDFYELVKESFTLTPHYTLITSSSTITVDYNFGYDCYQTKADLRLAYYTAYYNFLDSKNFNFGMYNIHTLEDFMNALNTWKFNGRNEMGGIGDAFAKNYLKVSVGGKIEDQPTTHFIGYCYQNNMFVDFIEHLMTFFAYWRTDEGYSKTDPNGNDFFASAWASMVDTAKFFYFTGDTLQDTYKWFDSERVHYALDHIPSVGRVTLDYTSNESIELPQDVTRNGYVFLGWVDKDGKKVTTVNQSMMVYATWGEAPIYTITAKTDNSTSGSNTGWYCATPKQTENGYVWGHRLVISLVEGKYQISAILTGDGKAIDIDYAYRVVNYTGSYQTFDSILKVGQTVLVIDNGEYITFEIYE